MHELAHIYLWNTLGSRMDYYNVEQCLSLPSKRTVGNAESYVYYVASMISPFPLFLLLAPLPRLVWAMRLILSRCSTGLHPIPITSAPA